MDTVIAILQAVIREILSYQTAGVAIAVIGLNIHFGFTGLLNFGQAGFMLLGAYGFAISLVQGAPIVLAVLIGLASAVVFALILGIPTLQLRGDYLAIVTISAAELVRFVGRLSVESLEKYTGGSQGIQGRKYQTPIKDLSFFGDTGQFTLLPFNYTDVAGGSGWIRLVGGVVFVAATYGAARLARRVKLAQDPSRPEELSRSLGVKLGILGLVVIALLAVLFSLPVTYDRTSSNGWWVRALGWSLVALSAGLVFLLVRSPWGRLLRGIREDEDAIRSLGKNVFAIKMQALVIGGLFGALGGMVYVLAGTVQPDALGRQITFFCFTALLLGGAATLFGPVLGTVLFFAGRVLVKQVSGAYLPDSILSDQKTDQFSYVIVGVALMLLVIFRPQGILGNKKEIQFDV